MPSSTARRPAKASSIARSAPVDSEREPRGARRRRETRSRVLTAALELMAERGMEGVAINDITEAADVGFGSFYNHFDSKEAIYEAVLEWVFEDFADAIERVTSEISDPAEIIAVSTRYTVMRALREPVWGHFLVREGFSPRSVDHGLGARLMRDIRRGIASRRLHVHDPLMSFVSLGGTNLGAISVGLQLGSTEGRQSAILRELGANLEHLPERTATRALEALGLSRSEAQKIAHRPLPAVDLPLADNSLAAGQITSKKQNDEPDPKANLRVTKRKARG